MDNRKVNVGIVGAGLAGLATAVELKQLGHDVLVFEQSETAGGRVRTKEIDDHLVDLGFQIFIEGYPEAKAILDYDKLNLRRFDAGAVVRKGDEFHEIGDPLRQPGKTLDTLKAPIGSVLDKLKLAKFRFSTTSGSTDELWQRPDKTTQQLFSELGFSDQIIGSFLQPLFSGITLDSDLASSSRSTEFVYRMLATSYASVPDGGMGQLSAQLANKIADDLKLGEPVDSVTATHINAAGTEYEFDAVVVATEIDTAAKFVPEIASRSWKGCTSIWYKAPEAPTPTKSIILGGSVSPIDNAAIMSNISATYAPADLATVVATSIADVEPAQVTAELKKWFGAVVDLWEILDVQKITKAQPSFEIGADRPGYYRSDSGIWACGDYLADSSINGAMSSGRKAAQAIVATL